MPIATTVQKIGFLKAANLPGYSFKGLQTGSATVSVKNPVTGSASIFAQWIVTYCPEWNYLSLTGKGNGSNHSSFFSLTIDVPKSNVGKACLAVFSFATDKKGSEVVIVGKGSGNFGQLKYVVKDTFALVPYAFVPTQQGETTIQVSVPKKNQSVYFQQVEISYAK